MWKVVLTVSTVENGEVPVAESLQAELSDGLSSVLWTGLPVPSRRWDSISALLQFRGSL